MPTPALEQLAQRYLPDVVIEYSTRRRKSISARWAGAGVIHIQAPTTLPVDTLERHIKDTIRKLRGSATDNDLSLDELATHLNKKYLRNQASWTSISWVTTMNNRWGSCSVNTRTIRISHRLRTVPLYVLSSVVLHELIHTFVPNHSAEFWAWMNRYEDFHRAEGYLQAYETWGPYRL